eukprot:3452035-Heterocapsa_arctica.AAC.1
MAVREKVERKTNSNPEVGNIPIPAQNSGMAPSKSRDEDTQQCQREALGIIRDEARQMAGRRSSIDPRIGVEKPVPNEGEEEDDKEQQTPPPNTRCGIPLRSESSILGDWLESILLDNKAVTTADIGREQAKSPQGDGTPLINPWSPEPDEQGDTDEDRKKEACNPEFQTDETRVPKETIHQEGTGEINQFPVYDVVNHTFNVRTGSLVRPEDDRSPPILITEETYSDTESSIHTPTGSDPKGNRKGNIKVGKAGRLNGKGRGKR